MRKKITHSLSSSIVYPFMFACVQDTISHMAKAYGFQYELVQYKWPRWLHQQTEKQRIIWGYKILFLDVLFPLAVDKIIFVDADQVTLHMRKTTVVLNGMLACCIFVKIACENKLQLFCIFNPVLFYMVSSLINFNSVIIDTLMLFHTHKMFVHLC